MIVKGETKEGKSVLVRHTFICKYCGSSFDTEKLAKMCFDECIYHEFGEGVEYREQNIESEDYLED
jgi:hypothetical protein